MPPTPTPSPTTTPPLAVPVTPFDPDAEFDDFFRGGFSRFAGIPASCNPGGGGGGMWGWPQCCNCGSNCPPGFSCGTCTIPAQNLQVNWTNIILGNGSTTLVYSGGPTPQWQSACTNQLLYELVCDVTQVEFRVFYFISGSCPSGQSQFCSTIRANPFGFHVTSLTCTGGVFDLKCQVTSSGCPILASNGYTNFEVTS